MLTQRRAAAVRARHGVTLALVVLAVLGGTVPWIGAASGGPSPVPPAATVPGPGPLDVPASLTAAQLAAALDRRDRSTAAQRSRLDALLAAAPPAERAYLAEAWAAGHSAGELESFAAAIAGHSRRWLTSHLALIDPGRTGAVRFRGARIGQYDDTTCGSAVLMAARMLIDPVYTFELTAARPLVRRLADEQRRIHAESGPLWPGAAGTPPWAMSDQMNRLDIPGVRYGWRMLPRMVPVVTGVALHRALSAADRGYPVPLLIGDLVPRHYVLLLGRDATGAAVYDPGAGEIVRLPPADLARRDFGRLGFPRLLGVVLPE